MNRLHITRRTLAALVLLGVAGCAASTAETQRKPREGKNVTDLPRTKVVVPEGKDVATLAGGCFWCTEALVKDLKGVESVMPGYAGGKVVDPSYERVCAGNTGHAEAVQIIFDPKTISYGDLLRIHLTTHDPTTLNRQGADVGTQYRSAIFTHGDAQKKTAAEVIKEVTASGAWDDPIVTEVTPFSNFYAAEEYHRDYFARNPEKAYCRAVIAPKVAKLREVYRERLKSAPKQ